MAKGKKFPDRNSAAALYVEGMGTPAVRSELLREKQQLQPPQAVPMQIQSCYVGGHTANKKFGTSQKPGMGQTPIQPLRILPGRYNVAAYAGFAGGLAAQLPADSRVANTYVSASVYSPTAEEKIG